VLLFDVEVTAIEEQLEQIFNAELAPHRRAGSTFNRRRQDGNQDAMGAAANDRSPSVHTITITYPYFVSLGGGNNDYHLWMCQWIGIATILNFIAQS
jgi:hypothetical protein